MNRKEHELYPREYEALQLELLRLWFPLKTVAVLKRGLMRWSYTQHYVRVRQVSFICQW